MDKIRNNSGLFLLCVLVFGFLICSKLHLTTAADTISFDDSLTGDQTIISRGKKFELGFFKPGNTSQNYYIGIWYKFSVQTVVWIANRNAPITDPFSSKLTFLYGNLVLLNNLSRTPVWSTNSASNTLHKAEVVLGDDGNLVLRDKSSPSVVIWQSFDYPTDTFLPGGKIGFSKRTNQTQQLTSWRSREDPATGFYSNELGPNRTNQLVIYWNKSEEIWKTGEWNETSKTFLLLPEMRLNPFFYFSLISNVNESFFTYTMYNKSTFFRLVMDISGQIKEYTWSESKWKMMWVQPKRLCDVYSICGSFGNCNQDTWKCECLPGFIPRSPADWSLQDSTGGCVRKTPLQCGGKVGFLPISTLKLPDKSLVPQIYGAEDCKSSCEGSCSCVGYALVNNGCRFWRDDIINFNQFNTSTGVPATFYLSLAASEIRGIEPISSSPVATSTASQAEKRKAIVWKIVIPVSALLAFIMGVLGYIYLFKRKKANRRGRLKGLQGVLTDLLKSKTTYNDTPNSKLFDDGKTEGETHELQIFNFACLANSTNNFCLKNKLGEGGFGPVYK
ncbi:hypothetical protein MKW98_018923, partial [Papaver atlanticum]